MKRWFCIQLNSMADVVRFANRYSLGRKDILFSVNSAGTVDVMYYADGDLG
jgi:hypothetical protein